MSLLSILKPLKKLYFYKCRYLNDGSKFNYKVDDSNKVFTVIQNHNSFNNYYFEWLRDHCSCKYCYSSKTNQRLLNLNQFDSNISIKSINKNHEGFIFEWSDNHLSFYNYEWLIEHHPSNPDIYDFVEKEMVVWNKDISNSLDNLTHNYLDIIKDENAFFQVVRSMLKYGMALIKNTPTTEQETGNIGRLFGPLKSTLFSDKLTWSFTGGKEDHQDLAYGNTSLDSHNDNSYFNCPSGIQAFHCLQKAKEGGQTVLVDGFNCVQQLKMSNPSFFNILTKLSIPAQYKENHYSLICREPIIKTDDRNRLIQIRFNNEDRSILTGLNHQQIVQFYQSYRALTKILQNSENELILTLEPGTTLLLNNWRVLHGRKQFTGVRTITGFYVDYDYLFSKINLLYSKKLI